MKILFSILTLVTIVATQSGSALTNREKKELYRFGTITVYEKDSRGKTLRDENGKKKKRGHFEFKYMDGTRVIKDDAKKEWNDFLEVIEDLTDDKETWRNRIIGSFNDGIDHIIDSFSHSMNTIPKKYQETIKKNHDIGDSFGSLAAKLDNWRKFTSSAGASVLNTFWGVGVNSIYSLLTPTGHLLYRSITAGTKVVAKGTIWPVLRLTWNGVAWNLVVNGEQTTPNEKDMTLTFVPETFDHTDSILSSDDEEESEDFEFEEM